MQLQLRIKKHIFPPELSLPIIVRQVTNLRASFLYLNEGVTLVTALLLNFLQT
jgi:hypothetical protein